MGSFQESMNEYKKMLEQGVVQQAYRGLLQYMMNLKTHFNNKYPEYSASGSLYHGYMDMTYFPLFPEPLKERKLKIAVVFNYDSFRFEVWLSGYNKEVQSDYWKLFNKSGWKKYRIVPPAKGIDSIVENMIVETPDFGDLDGLTSQIEKGTLVFIRDMENFLSEHPL